MEQDMLPHFEASPGNMNADQLIEQEIAANMRAPSDGRRPPSPRPSTRVTSLRLPTTAT